MIWQSRLLSCSYTISGNLTGLNANQVILQNNSSDDLQLNSNGTFTFTTQILDLQAYFVSVTSQPPGPIQSCSVTNGDNSVAGGAVTSVTVICEFGDDLMFVDGFE